MELAKKTVKNSFYGVIEFGWPVLTALLATPYIIRRLGVDAYGVLALITVVLGFFALLDLGLTYASIKYIAEEYSKKNLGNINKIINSTLFVYIIMGGIGLIIISLGSNIITTKLLNVSENLVEVTKFSFYIASFGFLINMVNGVFASIPKAVQRFDVSTIISVFIGTLTTASMVLLLYLGFWLKELVILNLAISFLSVVIYLIASKKLIPKLVIRPAFDKETFFKLLKYGSLFLFASISGLLVFHLDKFLIGAMLNISLVTYYVVPGNIAVKIQGLTSAMVAIVLPLSSMLSSKNQIDKIRALYFKGTKFILMIITMISVPLLVFSGKFLLYWLGPEFAAKSTTVMMMLVATYYFLSIAGVIWNISYGLGKAKINALFAFLTAFINIVLIFFLIKRLEIIGVALAYLISAVITTPLAVIYIERKVLKLSGFEFFRIYSRILFVGIIQGFIVFILERAASNMISVLALMVLSVFIFPLIYFLLGFFKDEDKQVVDIFKGLIFKN